MGKGVCACVTLWCVCTVTGVHDTDKSGSSFEQSSTDTQDYSAARDQATNKSLGRYSPVVYFLSPIGRSKKKATVLSLNSSTAAGFLRINQG